MTLDAAEIDLSKSFEKGMGYVALSRLKSLDGLRLLGINEQALEVDEDVLLFDEELREQSAKLHQALAKVDQKELQKLHDEFLARAAAVMRSKRNTKIETHIITKALIQKKMSLKEIAAERKLKVETILSHLEKLQEDNHECDIEYLKASVLKPALLKKITDAFHECHKKTGDYSLGSVRTYLKNTVSFPEVRFARLFLKK
jgi:ATP-dependent DNA helicase PIF1